MDGTGNAFLTGRSNSSDLPTANPFQPSYGGHWDAFVAKLSADGSALEYASYLGGNRKDFGYSITVDRAGEVLVIGPTFSTNFPTTPGAFDRTCGTDGTCNGAFSDVFVTRIGSSPVTSFAVAPFYAEVAAGVPFDLAVIALDANEFVIPDYTGEVLIVSTDPQGVTPVLYTFRRNDRGVATFPGGVTLATPGVQLLLVLDMATFSAVGLGIYVVA